MPCVDEKLFALFSPKLWKQNAIRPARDKQGGEEQEKNTQAWATGREIVQAFDEELAASRNEKLPKQIRSWELTLVLPFFAQMRRLALVGYYTSPIGQDQELKVEIIPGALHGCVPAKPEVKQ